MSRSHREHPTRVLVVSATFPSSTDRTRGIFVKERIKALSRAPGIELRVIVPTPWAPPIRSVAPWYQIACTPRHEMVEGLSVYRPRYLLPPKVGGYIHPQLMYRALLATASRIRKEFSFDLIDAHFVYPAGVAATRLAKHFNLPVCVTGRGEDMLRFPSLPVKGRSIRWALKNGDGYVALSPKLARAMVANGAAEDAVTVIPNGIDTEKFQPTDRQQCRRELGLPGDRTILLSVGDLVERKGNHLVLEALPTIIKQRPDVLYICVGGPGRHGLDFSEALKSRIARMRLESHVLLPGGRAHDELYKWHNASDLFVLASSREGSPNALLEALACGSPAVSTHAGGAADELEKTGFGVMMRERSADAAAEAILEALGRDWNRSQIRQAMERRSWDETAKQVTDYFSRLLPGAKTDTLAMATKRR